MTVVALNERQQLAPPAQKLELLPEAKLGDCPIRLRSNAVVGIPRVGLDFLVPLGAQDCERALVTGLRERIRLGSGLGEAHVGRGSDRSAGPMYRADGRNKRPVFFCSRMCADQPPTLEQANMAGARAGEIPAMSSTTAE